MACSNSLPDCIQPAFALELVRDVAALGRDGLHPVSMFLDLDRCHR